MKVGYSFLPINCRTLILFYSVCDELHFCLAFAPLISVFFLKFQMWKLDKSTSIFHLYLNKMSILTLTGDSFTQSDAFTLHKLWLLPCSNKRCRTFVIARWLHGKRKVHFSYVYIQNVAKILFCILGLTSRRLLCLALDDV